MVIDDMAVPMTALERHQRDERRGHGSDQGKEVDRLNEAIRRALKHIHADEPLYAHEELIWALLESERRGLVKAGTVDSTGTGRFRDAPKVVESK